MMPSACRVTQNTMDAGSLVLLDLGFYIAQSCKSISCDQTSNLFCCSELNPNLWTSEDVITQEPPTYNSDEQVSMLPTSKEAALGGQATLVYDPKVKNQKSCSRVEVHFIRPFQSSTQCQVSVDCSQTLPLKQNGCEDDKVQSHEILKFSPSISIKDFGLSLSESDQAETGFSELCDECTFTPQLGIRNSDPSLLVLPSEDLQATLAITEDDKDVAQKSMFSQTCIDMGPPKSVKVLYGHRKVPQISGVEMGFIPFKSSKEENTKPQVYSDAYLENIPFIDNDDDFKSKIPTAKESMVTSLPCSMTTSGHVHMACDSADRYYSCCSVSPDSENISHISKSKTASSSLFLPIPTHIIQQLSQQDVNLPSTFMEYRPLTPDSWEFENQCGSLSLVSERDIPLSEAWLLNDLIRAVSSPESVMSIGDYRAMSPDSPQAEKRVLPSFSSVLDDRWTLSPSSDQCSSPEVTTDLSNNKPHPNQLDS